MRHKWVGAAAALLSCSCLWRDRGGERRTYVDKILTNALLPDLSRELLGAMVEGKRRRSPEVTHSAQIELPTPRTGSATWRGSGERYSSAPQARKSPVSVAGDLVVARALEWR